LTARYTADYPDVVAVRRKIAELRKQMSPTDSSSPVATTSVSKANRTDSPAVLQLKAQLRAIESAIVNKRSEQHSISLKIGDYQSRLHASPMIQEQLKNITRDYQTAQAFYDELAHMLVHLKLNYSRSYWPRSPLYDGK